MENMSDNRDGSREALSENKTFEDRNESAFDSVSIQKAAEPIKLKTLADLIGFCRDKGLQVYDDKPNIPEADQIRTQALAEHGGSGAKKHRSDNKSPDLPQRSERNKSGKSSLKSGFDRMSSAAGSSMTRTDLNDVTTRKTSALGSVYSRSRATSRFSYVQDTNKTQRTTKDAEELLQQRMRRRSKRRRENRPGSLVDLMIKISSSGEKTDAKLATESVNSEPLDSMNISAITKDSNITGGSDSTVSVIINHKAENVNDESSTEQPQPRSSSRTQDTMNKIDPLVSVTDKLEDLSNEKNIGFPKRPETNEEKDQDETTQSISAYNIKETMEQETQDGVQSPVSNNSASNKEAKDNDIDNVVLSNTTDPLQEDENHFNEDDRGTRETPLDKKEETSPNGVENAEEMAAEDHGKKASTNDRTLDFTAQQTKSTTENKEQEADDTCEKSFRENDINSIVKEKKENMTEAIERSNDVIGLRQNSSSLKHERKEINNNAENVHSPTNKQHEKDNSEAPEKVIDEVRIKDGKSTLVLFKVREESVLSLGKVPQNVTWTKKGTTRKECDSENNISSNSDKPKQNKDEINVNESNEKSADENNSDGSNSVSLIENSNTEVKTLNHSVQDALKKDESDLDSDVTGAIRNESKTDLGTMTGLNIVVLEQRGNIKTNDMTQDSTPQRNAKVGKKHSSSKSSTATEVRRDDQGTDRREQPPITTKQSPSHQDGESSKTSIRSEKMLSAEARFLLLMETAKQFNEENSKDHRQTIELFEDTRQSLMKVSNDIINGVEEKEREENVGLRKEEEKEEKVEEGGQENEEEEITKVEKDGAESKEICQEEYNTNIESEEEQLETHEVKPNVKEEPELHSEEQNREEKVDEPPEMSVDLVKETKPKRKKVVAEGPKLSEEKIRALRGAYWNKDSKKSETFEMDGDEYYLDPNGDLVKSIKHNASKKIDTRWDPGHPMLQKIMNKNKSCALKGTSPGLHLLKTSKISTADIPGDNVYVQEAKRIFPQGFDTAIVIDGKTTTAHRKDKKNVKHEKAKTVDIGSNGNEENDTLTKVEATENNKSLKRKFKRNPSVPSEMQVRSDKTSEEGKFSTQTVLSNNKLRKVKSVSSTLGDSNAAAKTNHGKVDFEDVAKKKHIRTFKRNKTKSALESEDNNKLKADRDFIKDHRTIIDIAHGVGTHKNTTSSKQKNSQRPGKVSEKKSFLKLEFKSKGKESTKDMDDIKQFTIDDVSDQEVFINTKGNKTFSNGLQLGSNSRVSVISGKSDTSMSAAVEIAQSRSNFYNDMVANGEQSAPRGHRVHKLFKQIQSIRRQKTSQPLTDSCKSLISDHNSGFLFVNYNQPHTSLQDQREDSDINKFLYGTLDYEVCSKVKHVNSNFQRRVKAFDTLKHKMYIKS